MKQCLSVALIVLAVATLLCSHPALAQYAQEGPKLVGTGASGGALHGHSVSFSADGNMAIVGGPTDNMGAGAAWIWTRSGGVWTQQGGKLVGSGAAGVEAEQGYSVAVSGDGNTAIVGGPTDNMGAGAAWIWTRSGGVWTQQGSKLVGSGAAGAAGQGWSVALSADGNTAVVGGSGDNNGAGAAWVWMRSGGVWTQQGAKLVASGAVGKASQGVSVALSADGNTAIIGGHADNSFAGAAWVWTRSGGVWSQQGTKLVGSGAVGKAYQGWSVAVSADGNTFIVGGPYDDNRAGAAWIWTRSGGVWTQQGSKVIGSGASGNGEQGYSVALSADGNTAIIGALVDGGLAGAAWVWTRSGGIWTQQGSKLVGTGFVGLPQQGVSVSLSGDGDTAIVGGDYDQYGNGAAWIWVRSGGVWTQQGEKLIGSGSAGIASQGDSVALSADGNTAIVGGSSDNQTDGAVWIWTRSGGVWTQQGAKLIGSGAVGSLPARQGASVALSADGNTAIVGGPYDNDNDGAVWVWTRSEGVWTQQGTKLVGAGAVGHAFQGNSVSLSADGNTAITVGPLDNGNTGAVWVWTRSGVIWTQQGPKLVGSSAMNGTSVCLSADGNTAIIGAPGDNNHAGAAWIWTRSGGVWSQQGSKLVGSGAVGNAEQGYAVSLSGDGSTAIIGGPADNNAAGAAWIFSMSGGVWTQQGTKLIGSGAIDPAQQGYSVALSTDGNTAIVVGSRDNEAGGVGGAAWIWKRSGGIWTLQGSKLVGSGGSGPAQYSSASLSADGNTAIVGGNQDNQFTGAAWVFLNRSTALRFYTMTPCRVLDTRNQTGPLGAPSLQPGGTRSFDVAASPCGIPADARAISANLTVTNVGASGELVVFPADVPRPNSSAISFRSGRARANNSMVSFAQATRVFSVFNNSAAPLDFILDVNGFFR